jgi:hypothetical protein
VFGPKIKPLAARGLEARGVNSFPVNNTQPFCIVYCQYFAKNFTNANNSYVHTYATATQMQTVPYRPTEGLTEGLTTDTLTALPLWIWAGNKKFCPVGFLW